MCLWLRGKSLVRTCSKNRKNRKNRGFLRFSYVWDSYDQCEHPIPDIPDGRRFYDVIGRIGSISTLKVHPDGPIFTMSVNMKFAWLGLSPTIDDFYDECEHGICLSGTSGMLSCVFTFYQSLIFSEL